MGLILDPVQDFSICPSSLCQLFFIAAATSIVLIQALPPDMRQSLMDYGPRRPSNRISSHPVQPKHKSWYVELNGMLVGVSNYGQVPHSWFLHFYVLSASSSIFWIWQLLSNGSTMNRIAELEVKHGAHEGMDSVRVAVAIILMAAQGSRRLFESLFIMKAGASPMWLVHWGLGLVFYAVMGVSVWVEGSGSDPSPIPVSSAVPEELMIAGAILTESQPNQSIWHHWDHRPAIWVAIALWTAASLGQHACHRYLASLPKYTLPSKGLFKYIVSPHYTCECLIYLSLASVAAPVGYCLNRTVLCGLAFVAVNLGSTASGTKEWSAKKFGRESVAKKWKMIPLVF